MLFIRCQSSRDSCRSYHHRPYFSYLYFHLLLCTMESGDNPRRLIFFLSRPVETKHSKDTAKQRFVQYLIRYQRKLCTVEPLFTANQFDNKKWPYEGGIGKEWKRKASVCWKVNNRQTCAFSMQKTYFRLN